MRRIIFCFVGLVITENAGFIFASSPITPRHPSIAVSVVINEVVTDPQRDWSDSQGGNGVPFDNMPGTGSPANTDNEWLELYNAGTQSLDLTNWSIELIDLTPATFNFNNPPSDAVLNFSASGSISNFQPGEYLVIGNPPGAINNDIYIVLKDGSGAIVDDVEIGNDFQGDGDGDGAPDGGTSDGNATGINDEAVARFPNGTDTGNDVNDFVQQAATIGASNGEAPTGPFFVVINEVVTDPQQDWSDDTGGNGIPFDDVPGPGPFTDADAWVELFNAGTQAINLIIGNGWTIEFINGTNTTLNFKNPGSTVLRFSAGGSVTNFQPGEYLVIGNPPGTINNDIYIVLKDGIGAMVDDVEIGDNFEGDADGDGAPDGGASDGNATGVNDEAVARFPNAVDTDNDVNDFTKQAATIGASNGEVVIAPDIAVDPDAHDYGEVTVGSCSDQAFIVSNTGTGDLAVSATDLVDSDEFSVVSGGAPFTIPPGGDHDLVVRFCPASVGEKSATLRLVSDDPDENLLEVFLAGDGVEPFCDLSVSPTAHDFENVEIGDLAGMAFELSNAANATTSCVGNAAIFGDPAFSIVSGEDFFIAPGETHRLVVRFDCRGEDAGEANAILRLTTDDRGTIEVPLTGRCEEPKFPDLAVAPARLDFGKVQVGKKRDLSIVISNEGTADLEINATSLIGENADQWQVTKGAASFTLAPGDQQEVTVSFKPTSSGSKSAKLRIRSNDSDEDPFDVVLRGNGTPSFVLPPDVVFACPTSGAPPLRVVFENRFTNPATGFLWEFGDGATSTEFQPVHVYAQTGTYDVSLTVHTDTASATLTLKDFITVRPHFVEPAPLVLINGVDFAIKSTGNEVTCGWNLGTSGFMSNEVTITGDNRWFVLEVIAASTFAGGEWARMELLIDDIKIGERLIANNLLRTYRFLARLAAGTHTVKLNFPNAFFNPSTGETRNLIINRMLAFDSGTPLSVPGNLNAAAMAIKSHGAAAGGGAWNLSANGFLGHGLAVADSGSFELKVTASGRTALGESPKLLVKVDGVAQDTVEVASTTPQDFSFPLTLASGSHLLQLKFVNDFSDSTAGNDRNLILHRFAVNGMVPPLLPKVVVNEVVADPQQDWNDSAGGNGVPFDNVPGNGSITETDEWIELFNADAQAIDLTAGDAWSVELINGTNTLLNFNNPGTAVLRFSAGGSVTNFQPGEYLVIGNPPGAINNDVYIILRDQTGAIVDDVEIGDDFEGDGNGDGAPDGGTSDGNATGNNDETVARFPNGTDTDNDVNDFAKQAATIGASNGEAPTEPFVVVINEVVADPQQDWSDNSGGNGIPFDNVPGTGSITVTDEWIELFNAGTQAVNLIVGNGWTIELINGTNEIFNFKNPGSAVLRFSAGGSVTNFQPGEYLVIGNPPGAINNDVYIILRDQTGAVVDDVEIGDDFEGDGNGDGAPDGGASDGNATGINDEAVARFPNASDTDNDVNDFAKQAATIGASNDGTSPFNPPIARAVADTLTGPVPLRVQFSCSTMVSNVVVASCHWNFGDGSESIEQNPQHIYIQSGSFLVRLTATDNFGRSGRDSLRVTATPGPATGVNGKSTILPEGFLLAGNFPNPFNPSTKITFGLPEPSQVVLTVHNVSGQEVARLLEDELAAGQYEREWNAAHQASGIYFCRLAVIGKVSGNQVNLVKKMVRAK
jgi:PKD repeat protein